MGISYFISCIMLKGFALMCAPGDNKRLAGQEFPTDLTEVNNLPYIDDGNPLHLLDIYYPEDTKPTDKLPVVVDMHGGGWSYGDKDLNKNYCLHIAQRGFVVFNISYRLAPKNKLEEQMRDCMAALEYVSKVMKQYPCDTKRVYLTGDSAGGMFASHCAGANLSKRIRKAYDCANPKLKIKAVCLTSGVPYLNKKGPVGLMTVAAKGKKAKKKEYSKYFDFNKILKECDDYPPTILFTSTMDVVAKGQTKKTYKMLKKKGVDAKLDYKRNPSLMHVYPVLDPESKYGAKAIDKMAEFFEKHQ